MGKIKVAQNEQHKKNNRFPKYYCKHKPLFSGECFTSIFMFSFQKKTIVQLFPIDYFLKDFLIENNGKYPIIKRSMTSHDLVNTIQFE